MHISFVLLWLTKRCLKKGNVIRAHLTPLVIWTEGSPPPGSRDFYPTAKEPYPSRKTYSKIIKCIQYRRWNIGLRLKGI